MNMYKAPPLLVLLIISFILVAIVRLHVLGYL